ncbi:MAG: hypothetical protein DMG09_14480 [Acidobacteria bacterium]|nr:MAG: hypothetical protein DMG09_14480 [Acidobacteriota bacterium]
MRESNPASFFAGAVPPPGSAETVFEGCVLHPTVNPSSARSAIRTNALLRKNRIFSVVRFISSSSFLQVRIRRNLACVIAQESPPEVFRVDRLRIVATRMPMSGFHLSVNLSERYGLPARGVFVGRRGITGNFPLVPTSAVLSKAQDHLGQIWRSPEQSCIQFSP